MNINRLVAPLLLAIVFVFPMSVSQAYESSSSFAVTSNYVFRGQTQTNDGSAVQFNYDLEQSEDEGWYTGAFASTVNSGMELDLFAGWKGTFDQKANMGYDIGLILYKYTDNKFSPDVNEIYAGLNYETAYVKLYNGSGAGVSTYNYLDLGASFIVLDDIDLDLHYGRFLNTAGTNDVSANVAFEVKNFDLGLGVTYEDGGAKNDLEFFVTLGKTFN